MSSVPQTDIPVIVTRAEKIADGIHLFEMKKRDGAELPGFTAGSHINLRVPNGLVRKYSLCSDPANRDSYAVAIKREDNGRGGSIYLIDHTKVGDEWMISAPDNAFALPQRGDNFIFIAGGIGITPFIAMIHALKHDPAKKFKLYYCSRTPEMTAFREELSAPELKGKVVIHYDEGDVSKSLDLWPIVEERKNREHLYCCGPRGLMQAVRDSHRPLDLVRDSFRGLQRCRRAPARRHAVQRQAFLHRRNHRRAGRHHHPGSACAPRATTCRVPAKAAPAAPAGQNFSPAKPIIAIWC